MLNKKVKNMLKDAFASETPNCLSKIKSQCENIKQKEVFEEKTVNKKAFSTLFIKRISFAVLTIMVFFVGVFIGGSNLTPVSADKTSIYLDVNPSIEIQIDENDKVLKCIANNEDALNILEDISLEGVNINTALYAIVGSMYSNGYLTKDKNSILVSIEDKENQTLVLENIVKQIQNIFKNNSEMECSIIGQELNYDESLKQKANEYGISIGKLRLIEKIIHQNEVFEENNIEELVKMSIHELNLLYQANDKEEVDGEYVSGKPGGFMNVDEILDYVCETLGIDKERISKNKIYTLYHHNQKFEKEMIYVIEIIYKDSSRKYKYILNSLTGELLNEEALEGFKDKFDDKFEDHLDEKELENVISNLEKQIKELCAQIQSSLTDEKKESLKEQLRELMDEYEELMDEYEDFKEDKNPKDH